MLSKIRRSKWLNKVRKLKNWCDFIEHNRLIGCNNWSNFKLILSFHLVSRPPSVEMIPLEATILVLVGSVSKKELRRKNLLNMPWNEQYSPDQPTFSQSEAIKLLMIYLSFIMWQKMWWCVRHLTASSHLRFTHLNKATTNWLMNMRSCTSSSKWFLQILQEILLKAWFFKKWPNLWIVSTKLII